MAAVPAVVKVGGSLYHLPDLGPRLHRFLAGLQEKVVLIVPGGGAAADAVRTLDQLHVLGEERSHWLALRALTLNAHFLAELLAQTEVVDDPRQCEPLDGQGRLAILDGFAFGRRDEREHPEQAMPHRWGATSDSLAIRAASVVGAQRLFLLKSVTIPSATDWKTAARMGWVDEMFPVMVERAGPGLRIEAINLRESRWAM